ncbi:MAG: hypothetical protein RLZZ42_1042, partial [Bacteroidota bacterium]
MRNLNKLSASFSAKITATLLFFAIATAVFAVDGIIIRSKS